MTRPWLVPAALLVVWVVWGSTYYAIRVALESFPPFQLGASRLTLAGVILMVFLRARGTPLPTAVEWRNSFLVGTLLFLGGNGSVLWAEQHVSSSLTAILVGAVPVWTTVVGLAFAIRPTRRQTVGVAVGLLGVVVLNLDGELRGNSTDVLVLALGSASWALGSVLAHTLPLPEGPMASGAQMYAGGIVLAAASLLAGETSRPISGEALAAWFYLLTFGSLLAFSAYGYLMRNTSLPVAMSYAYVNPVVAVVLGVGLGGESVGVVAVGGLVIIVAAVWLVTGRGRTGTTGPAAPST